MSDTPNPKIVKCPEPFRPLFAQAESIMENFFTDMQRKPAEGDIQISGVRYLLMRTDSLSIELQEELRKTFGDEVFEYGIRVNTHHKASPSHHQTIYDYESKGGRGREDFEHLCDEVEQRLRIGQKVTKKVSARPPRVRPS